MNIRRRLLRELISYLRMYSTNADPATRAAAALERSYLEARLRALALKSRKR